MKNVFRNILSWFSQGLRLVDSHYNYLQSNISCHHVSEAERHGGYKPRLHMEKEIVNLLHRSGLSKLFRKIDDVKDDELRDVLQIQKDYMSKRKTLNLDKYKLVAAATRVAKYFQGHVSQSLVPQMARSAVETMNMQASAGYPYYRKKGAVIDALLSDFNKLSFSELRLFPIMIAFRVSLSRKLDTIVKKIRCIYPYPGVITLHELRFLNPFMEAILGGNSLYATGLTGKQISDRIIHGSKYRYNFSTDISKFDLNMPNELIHASFSALRSCFRLGKKDIEAFEFIRDYFCTAYLSTRVGKGKSETYIKMSGLPSGSGFTNLIGTIAHCIILEYFEQDFILNNYCNVCSDDNLFFSNKQYSKQDIINMYSPFGMQPNLDECQFNEGIGNIFFLGFNWVKQNAILIGA